MRLKHLVEDRDRHGTVRLYVRVPGRPKVRIRARPGSPEFLAEYQAALAHGGTVFSSAQGTLGWLREAYYRSAEFRRLDPQTRQTRRLILDKLPGDRPYRLLQARHIRRMRDARADRPWGANNLVKALRRLYGWAMETDLADANPARDVSYLKGNPDGFHTWSLEEVAQYRARHPIGTKARLALELMLFLGVRRSDVVKLGPQMVRGGRITFETRKGKARLVLPILPQLRAVIDNTPSGHLAYLVTEFGKPFSAAGFGNKMREWCDQAGLPHCSAHGLRKAGATIAAENGATEHQLMAIFGWASPKQAAVYTRQASRQKLAGAGMHLLSPEQAENEKCPTEAAESVPPEPISLQSNDN